MHILQKTYLICALNIDVGKHAQSHYCVLPGQDCSNQEDTSHRSGPTPRKHPTETNEDVTQGTAQLILINLGLSLN